MRIPMILCALAMTACGASPERLATMKAQSQFALLVKFQVVKAENDALLTAIQAALAEEEWIASPPQTEGENTVVLAQPDNPAWASALAGGLTALGSTDDYGADEEGCRITIRRGADGSTLRADCYEMVEDGFGQKKGEKPNYRRVNRSDAYLVARIIEHVDPAAAVKLWAAEPTGHRTLRCANQSMGPSFLNFGCPDPRPRPTAAAPRSATPG